MNKLRIRKLGVLSVAKIQASIMFIISLLISIPYGLIVILYSLVGGSALGGNTGLGVGVGGVVFGLLIMIGLPIMYSIIGFIGGAIASLLYNLFAGWVGGIEIEVESIY
jgi:hypothetical protein